MKNITHPLKESFLRHQESNPDKNSVSIYVKEAEGYHGVKFWEEFSSLDDVLSDFESFVQFKIKYGLQTTP